MPKVVVIVVFNLWQLQLTAADRLTNVATFTLYVIIEIDSKNYQMKYNNCEMKDYRVLPKSVKK